MKILCIEDGSVDIDKLEGSELKDGGIIVYRQGSTPPYVIDMGSNKIEFAIEKLREIKNEIDNNAFDSREEECKVVSHFKANTIIQKKIEELANE